MTKPYLSKNLTLLGSLALGVIAVTGIATAPAQAVGFTELSTLEWDDGTSDFREDVDFLDGDTFDVTFSPASLGGVASVFIATGDFAPFFDTPEFVTVNQENGGGVGATGTFIIEDGSQQVIDGLTEAIYILDNDLVFTFDTDQGDVVATLSAGSRFVGIEEADNSVEFALEGGVDNGEWFFELPNDIEGSAFASDFVFADLPTEDGGTYGAEGVAGVPEPTTILGLFTVVGLGLDLKRKKQW